MQQAHEAVSVLKTAAEHKCNIEDAGSVLPDRRVRLLGSRAI